MSVKCCANCIGDRYLRLEIIPIYSTEKGACMYCGSKDQALVDAVHLKDYFELLLSVYAPDDSGENVIKLLKKDWNLFSHPEMDNAKSQVLLSEILDDGDIVRQLFSPSTISNSKSLAQWSEFRKELMYKNRFFPQMDIEHDRLKELLDFLLLDKEEIPTSMYRARLNKGDEAIPIDKMGAPPSHLASHGRANPAGIPYLYMASDTETAISEIRPHTGESATIALIRVSDDLSLVDLRDSRSTVSPFMLGDESHVAALMGDISFLESLGNELKRPVLPSAAAIDYVPSQYVCEFAKTCGYDGVVYGSSVGNGLNMALFYPDRVKFRSVSQHYVNKVAVEVCEIPQDGRQEL